VGGSDHESLLGTEPCAKVGSGGLQPSSVPFRGHFAHSVVRNSLLLGHCRSQGEREVTDRVNRPFHARSPSALQIAIEAHRNTQAHTIRGL